LTGIYIVFRLSIVYIDFAAKFLMTLTMSEKNPDGDHPTGPMPQILITYPPPRFPPFHWSGISSRSQAVHQYHAPEPCLGPSDAQRFDGQLLFSETPGRGLRRGQPENGRARGFLCVPGAGLATAGGCGGRGCPLDSDGHGLAASVKVSADPGSGSATRRAASRARKK
jgi:hypothetical protein